MAVNERISENIEMWRRRSRRKIRKDGDDSLGLKYVLLSIYYPF